jgi:DNA-binding response OmpR family regulator
MATILVADDDQLFRAIIRDELEQADHTVLEAGDGMAALDIALEERPEVLLLDVMMPLARGLEVVRRVRQQEDWHPAIVMISARTRVTDRLNALEAGTDAYVEKPVAPDDLLATINRLLTEVEPARYVDILGPVWATLAIGRLAKDAIARRSSEPNRETQVQALFTGLVAGSVGRGPVPAPTTGPAAAALRLLWEDAIRALLRDAVEPIPVVTDVRPPDALAAVERVIGNETLLRHRSRFGPAAVLPGFWHTVLTDTFATRAPTGLRRQGPAAPLPGDWNNRLRQVLGQPVAPEALVTQWSEVLVDVLAPSDHAPAVPTIDPLGTVWLAAATRAAHSEQLR